LALFMIYSCRSRDSKPVDLIEAAGDSLFTSFTQAGKPLYIIVVPREIRIKDYFRFIDSIVLAFDTLTPYRLSEHLLVRSNPWIIDNLENTDYYHQKTTGVVVYDQRQLPVLHTGDSIFIPDQHKANDLLDRISQTQIDINIPEFALKVIERGNVVHCISVRVGQNVRRYQQATGRFEDLRTKPGTGKVVNINREPTVFLDPHTGNRFTHTKRDDGEITRMPLIPWLEPEINGIRIGQLLHPTTNKESIGKAYSNGCIGFTEGEAWRLYYYAPIGTRLTIRYDLTLVSESGDTTLLPDIYDWGDKKRE
jgi:L,D-transpeptidase ErfK/SrfK